MLETTIRVMARKDYDHEDMERLPELWRVLEKLGYDIKKVIVARKDAQAIACPAYPEAAIPDTAPALDAATDPPEKKVAPLAPAVEAPAAPAAEEKEAPAPAPAVETVAQGRPQGRPAVIDKAALKAVLLRLRNEKSSEALAACYAAAGGGAKSLKELTEDRYAAMYEAAEAALAAG